MTLIKTAIKKLLLYPGARRNIKEWRAFLRLMHNSALTQIRASLVPVIFSDSIDVLDKSWRLPTKAFPYSCTDEEGLVLAFTIAKNGLKKGFEVATAFGFSSMYIGLALSRNGGALTTLDCYVEEELESFYYDDSQVRDATKAVRLRIAQGDDPVGLRVARSNAKVAGLTDAVTFEVGMSPEDVPLVVKDKRFDFVYIDGGHFGEQPLKDFRAIEPYLEDRCAIFFHDNNNNKSVAQAVEYAQKAVGGIVIRFPTRFWLTLVGRKLDGTSLVTLQQAINFRRTVWPSPLLTITSTGLAQVTT